MPLGDFSPELKLLATGDLEVTGPYNPNVTGNQEVIGDVFVGFLIIQNDAQDNPTVIVDGVAFWKYNPPVSDGSGWAQIVPAAEVRKAGLKPGRVRAIGTAVQVTRYAADETGKLDPRTPPAVQTVTWCVDRPVVAE